MVTTLGNATGMAHPEMDSILERIAYLAGQMRLDKIQDYNLTPDLIRVAAQYLRAYEGTFAFILDLQSRARSLSNRQIAAVLNCAIADAKRQHEALRRERQNAIAAAEKTIADAASRLSPNTDRPMAVGAAIPMDRQLPGNGTYTVPLADGCGHVTLRLVDADPDRFSNLAPGTRIVSVLTGADNEIAYTGFAFLSPIGELRPWRRYQFRANWINASRVLLRSVDPSEYGMAYALASGNCWRCNRRLTVPASIHRGLGPICADK